MVREQWWCGGQIVVVRAVVVKAVVVRAVVAREQWRCGGARGREAVLEGNLETNLDLCLRGL